MNKREIGRRMEEKAAACLTERGYRILERNFYAGHKEIDIVAEESGYLVFLEVKYTKDVFMGDPSERVDGRKQANMRRAAREYLYRKRIPEDRPCRFDVVRILGDEVSVIKDAFL